MRCPGVEPGTVGLEGPRARPAHATHLSAAKVSNLPPRIKSPVLNHSASGGWRRVKESNPRAVVPGPVFKTGCPPLGATLHMTNKMRTPSKIRTCDPLIRSQVL